MFITMSSMAFPDFICYPQAPSSWQYLTAFGLVNVQHTM